MTNGHLASRQASAAHYSVEFHMQTTVLMCMRELSLDSATLSCSLHTNCMLCILLHDLDYLISILIYLLHIFSMEQNMGSQFSG